MRVYSGRKYYLSVISSWAIRRGTYPAQPCTYPVLKFWALGPFFLEKLISHQERIDKYGYNTLSKDDADVKEAQ